MFHRIHERDLFVRSQAAELARTKRTHLATSVDALRLESELTSAKRRLRSTDNLALVDSRRRQAFSQIVAQIADERRPIGVGGLQNIEVVTTAAAASAGSVTQSGNTTSVTSPRGREILATAVTVCCAATTATTSILSIIMTTTSSVVSSARHANVFSDNSCSSSAKAPPAIPNSLTSSSSSTLQPNSLTSSTSSHQVAFVDIPVDIIDDASPPAADKLTIATSEPSLSLPPHRTPLSPGEKSAARPTHSEAGTSAHAVSQPAIGAGVSGNSALSCSQTLPYNSSCSSSRCQPPVDQTVAVNTMPPVVDICAAIITESLNVPVSTSAHFRSAVSSPAPSAAVKSSSTSRKPPNDTTKLTVPYAAKGVRGRGPLLSATNMNGFAKNRTTAQPEKPASPASAARNRADRVPPPVPTRVSSTASGCSAQLSVTTRGGSEGSKLSQASSSSSGKSPGTTRPCLRELQLLSPDTAAVVISDSAGSGRTNSETNID